MKNNTKLTLLEIEQIREAAKVYAEDYLSPIKYILLEEIADRRDGYDFTAVCTIIFHGDREEGHVLGINRTDDGFVVPLD